MCAPKTLFETCKKRKSENNVFPQNIKINNSLYTSHENRKQERITQFVDEHDYISQLKSNKYKYLLFNFQIEFVEIKLFAMF